MTYEFVTCFSQGKMHPTKNLKKSMKMMKKRMKMMKMKTIMNLIFQRLASHHVQSLFKEKLKFNLDPLETRGKWQRRSKEEMRARRNMS